MKVLSTVLLGLFVCAVLVGRAATITVTTTDNSSLPGDGVTSLDEALRAAVNGDVIRFNIPGPGPHYITTPIGGYPLITAHNLTIDGYSQPGSRPNTNSILGGNRADIRIVLDSTGDESLPYDPQDPFATARRSTRILYSNYGDTENGMLVVLGADNVTIRGLSFIARRTPGTVDDPELYAVALVNEAINARIQGCWFGLAPGGSTMADVKPVSSAVAAFLFQLNPPSGPKFYSSGCIIGTDGDGVNDRGEFNVIVGCKIAMALEVPGARVAGNYVNVFPNGLTFVDIDQSYAWWREVILAAGGDPGNLDASIENLENGDSTDSTVIGTNGDGVSDADERNVFGNTVYPNTMEFYRAGQNIVIAGNYFGVGVDGTTAAPVSTNIAPDFLRVSKASTALLPRFRVGSNGDGISDDVEGNLIFNIKGQRFFFRNNSGAGTQLVGTRNRLVNCNVAAVPFRSGDGTTYTTYYASYLANSAAGVVPVLTFLAAGRLNGTVATPAAPYSYVTISVYVADPAGLAKTNFWPNVMTHPGRHLISFADNGPEDWNLALNEFSVDVSGFGITEDTYVTVAATYSANPFSNDATNAVTSPMSSPISLRPKLQMRLLGNGTSELSWIAPWDVYWLQSCSGMGDAGGWTAIGPGAHSLGRNVITVPIDSGSGPTFYRVGTR